jgi:hypothetical protein
MLNSRGDSGLVERKKGDEKEAEKGAEEEELRSY